MGEYAEDAINSQDAFDAEDQLRAALVEYSVWTTKDGRRIPVRQMSTEHVQNTLAMLKRKEAMLDEFHSSPFRESVDMFEAELERRSADKRGSTP